MKTKHLLSLLLAAVMLISVMTPCVSAVSSTSDFTYEIVDGEVTVTDYNGAGGSVTVPSEIEGMPVTTIGSYAFENHDTITEVILPDTVKYLNTGAFFSCMNLESVRLSQNLLSIEMDAFGSCRSLKSISIPASVTYIAEGAFRELRNMESISVDENNPYYYSSGNCLIETDTQMLLAGCNNSVIPDGVEIIGAFAFSFRDSLTSINLPDSLKELHFSAFHTCTALQSITLPEGITLIEAGAFGCCDSLTSVVIPHSVKILESAFYLCNSLTTAYIPSTTEWVGEYVFEGCHNMRAIYCDLPYRPYTWDEEWNAGCDATVYWRGEFEPIAPPSSAYVNLALGKDYEISQQFRQNSNWEWDENAEITYPDEGKTLTDGCVFAAEDTIYDSVWAGFNPYCPEYGEIGYSYMTIDLGKVTDFDRVVLHALKDSISGISVPYYLEYYVSEDGSNYTNAGFLNLNATDYTNNHLQITFEAPMQGRYLQIRYNMSGWVFFSEAEVYHAGIEFAPVPPASGDGETAERPENAENFWVTHYNNSTVEGAGVIFTEPYEHCAWWLHVAFAPISAEEHLYEIVDILDGTEYGTASPLDIPEGGFVWAANFGNDYPSLGMTGADYETVYARETIEYAQTWSIGDQLIIGGIDFETVPTSTPNLIWYDDAYVCTSYITPYSVQAKSSLDHERQKISGSFNYSYSKESNEITISDAIDCEGLVITPLLIGDTPVRHLADSTFEGESFTRLIISDGVKTVGARAAADNKMLTEVFIPASVLEMGASVFAGCDQLENIYCMANEQPEGWDPAWLDGCDATVHFMPVLSPDEQLDGYTYWYNGESFIITSCVLTDQAIEVPASIAGIPVTELYDYSFSLLTDLQTVVIPDSVTEIGGYAFYNDTALQTAALPNSVTSLGDSAFAGCSALTSVTLSDGLTEICRNTFSNCTSLNSLVIPEGVTALGAYALNGCRSLESLSLPSSLTDIDTSALLWCSSMKDLQIDADNPIYYSKGNCLIEKETDKLIRGFSSSVIPDGVKCIAYEAFTFSQELKTVVIPDSVTCIESWAFAGCSALESVVIPDSVTTVNGWAFDYTSALADIYCEAESQPEGWSDYWTDGCAATVHWGYQAESERVAGDANGDGEVNGKDLTRLMQYFANYDYQTDTSSVELSESADCNGDGILDGRDCIRLMRYLAEYDPNTGDSSVELG